MKYFGLNRVISPKDVLPVAAWQLDNDSSPKVGEALLDIEKIQIEKESFNQICASCSYDVEKIKAKIIDIVDMRGKLQNPYTKTGGVFLGSLLKLGKDYANMENIKVGDKVYCICSTCGIPMVIEKIHSIDFKYGQINCTGKAIVFDTTPIRKVIPGIKEEFVLSAMDEAGNLYGLYKIAKNKIVQSAIIIGNTATATMLYAQAIREAMIYNNVEGKITVVMDKNSHQKVQQEATVKALEDKVDDIYFVDLVRPIEAAKEMMPLDKIYTGIADKVVVIEDVFGAESLAVSIVKEKGHVYFSSSGNNYWTAAIATEGLGKQVYMHVFDQYEKEHPEFTFMLVEKLKKSMEKASKLWDKSLYSDKLQKTQKLEIKDGGIGRAGEKGDFVFQSLSTKQMVDEVLNISKYDCNVIIQGETGVGKEMVLKLIHENSNRRSGPCIKINCATINENLAESEFFGYEKGAFTGARDDGKPGYFELANNGILFLDEIGTLPLHMQSKLLRVIQESEFYRVGGSKSVSVNVRVIVANNVPLKKLVEEGSFREDLYYRLNICTIDVPPLRERREDIICLAEAFVSDWAKQYSMDKEIDNDALRTLYYHSWPGNVRELENVVHRLVISSKGNVINKTDVDQLIHAGGSRSSIPDIKRPMDSDWEMDFHKFMDRQEKEIISYALEHGGSTRKAAEILGLPQTTFARKKLKHGL
ncbi:sigma-54 interaction domain-containing protein [Eubacteriales bacterium KG127]